MARVRSHVWISGLVQGVNFRYYTQKRALRAGLTGWVRNVPDGRVEAVFEGEEAVVADMVRWCHQGPSGAIVERVEERREPPTGEFWTFEIARTPYQS
ncbi:MAG: acylphosphatase [Chloroflexi bacterium]|nr:acylphosphatase [Chloroflexota bacterium]